jgi:hypothetical protein
MILKPVCNGAGMCPFVDFETIHDPVLIEHVMQFTRICSQAVLISDVN